MSFSGFLKFCHCDGTQICPFCQLLTIVVIALVAGFLGYLLAKRKTDKSGPK